MAPVIRELSKGMINKIAAGEVIERPANVVKELAENSVDAGAKKVDVEIDKSGVELIRVTDNGCGIEEDQILLALSPHSTSKISEPDDLFHISTLGFRGEALASIAEVTHLTLTSRAKGAPSGAQISCEGGERGEIRPVGRAVGTTIEARNLFFNVPVRRKFLRSPQTEFSHIQEAIVRLAVPHIEVAFTLKHNGRIVLDLPVADDMIDRIRRAYGENIASKLVKIESSYRDIRVSGYVGLPDLSRGTPAMQYLFVNGRFFRDKALQHALSEAYRGLLLVGKYPVAFLNIETPPSFVDVNVHPTKQEVRFLDGQAMYAGLLSGIREQFLRSDLRSRPTNDEVAVAARNTDPNQLPPEPAKAPDAAAATSEQRAPVQPTPQPVEPASAPDEPEGALDSSVAADRRSAVLSWLRGGESAKEDKNAPDSAKPDPASPASAPNDDAVADANAMLEEAAEAAARERGDYEPNVPAKPAAPTRPASAPNPQTQPRSGGTSEFIKFPPLNPFEELAVRAAKPPADSPTGLDEDALRARVAAQNAEHSPKDAVARTSTGRPVVQMCSRYLVMETQDGMAIIDQHALHERILYEKLKASLLANKIVVQKLLTPEVVDLNPTEATFAVEKADLFAKIGLTVEPFGGSTVVIKDYPTLLGALGPGEIFQTALAVFLDKKKADVSDLVDAALKQAACKAAIKAGDSLHKDSVVELIALAEAEINSHHCPHGRPSVLVLSCAEIDKLFKRT